MSYQENYMLFMVLPNIKCPNVLVMRYFYIIIFGILRADHIFERTKIICPKKYDIQLF